MKRTPFGPALFGLLAFGLLAGPAWGGPDPLEPSWIRPTGKPGSPPRWGIAGGIAVALHPQPGPRGLIRIETPYLGHPPGRVVNFVSIEPVIGGRRGQSELEPSASDGQPGKLIRSADTLELADDRGGPAPPASGRVIVIDGQPALTVFLHVEPFRNGARPIIQVLLRSDRPEEVAFRVYSAPGGRPMDSCVLSATMGNYMRLRRLFLRDEVIEARRLWPRFEPDPLGFAPWRAWGVDRLNIQDGWAEVQAQSDEPDPAAARYDPAVPPWWRYTGRPATQAWSARSTPGLVVRVNGRTTYWGGGGPIPGGIAFENFELEAPFEPGQEFRFRVRPLPPPKPEPAPGQPEAAQ